MKKILTVVGLAAVLSLTGCSLFSGGEDRSSESKSVEAKITVTPTEAPPTVAPTVAATPSESAAPTEESVEAPLPEVKFVPSDFVNGSIPDNQYVELVRQNTTAMGDVSDDGILLTTGKACASLGNGENFEELLHGVAESIQTSIETNTGAQAVYNPGIGNDAGFIVGSGVKVYCPQYEETLKVFVPTK